MSMNKFLLLASAILLAGATTLGLAVQSGLAAEPSLPIIISAVQISGDAAANDYIELFNPTDQPVSLAGLRLVKRSETGTSDSAIKSWSNSSTVEIPAHSFFLWANTNFTSISKLPDDTTSSTLANNNGVAIRLGDLDSGELIDSISWGSADNGFVKSGVANPESNQALVRENLYGAASYKLADHNPRNTSVKLMPGDNEETTTTNTCSDTTNEEQTESEEDEDEQEQTQTSSNFSGLLISEVYATPGEGQTEYLELYNSNNALISLQGLIIKIGSRQQTLGQINLGAKSYLALSGDDLTVPLANNGQTIKLLAGDDHIVSELTYPKLKTAESYALFGSNYKITKQATPNQPNQLVDDEEAEQDQSEQEENGSGGNSDNSNDQSGSSGGGQDQSGNNSDQSSNQSSQGSNSEQSGNEEQTNSTNPIQSFINDLVSSVNGGDNAEGDDQNDKGNVAGAVALGLAVIGIGTYAMYKFGIAQHWPF